MNKADSLNRRGTKGELARWLEVSERTVTSYISRLGLKPDRFGKYATLSCMQEQARREKADPRRQVVAAGEFPPIRTWSDVERSKRAEKLDVQIAALQGQMVTIDEVKRTLAELCGAFRHGLQNFVEAVSAEAEDGRWVEWAERLRDATLRETQEAISSDGK